MTNTVSLVTGKVPKTPGMALKFISNDELISRFTTPDPESGDQSRATRTAMASLGVSTSSMPSNITSMATSAATSTSSLMVSSASASSTPFATPRNVAGASRATTPGLPASPERDSDSSWTPVKKKSSQRARLTNQEKIAANQGRTRLCADFLLGKCKKAHKCTLLHDISFMVPDEQKVFIGGIPRNTSSRTLIKAVETCGFKVLNIPKCNPTGFAPKVCMESVEHAKAFLKVARIQVGKNIADVRRFKDSRAVNPDNYCVIVEGVPEGMTGFQIMESLDEQGFLIERSPLVKLGTSTIDRMEMTTVENADAISEIGEITIRGHKLNVKPFFDKNDGRNITPTTPGGPQSPAQVNTPRSAYSDLSGRSLRKFPVLSKSTTPSHSMRRGRTRGLSRARTESERSGRLVGFLNRAMTPRSKSKTDLCAMTPMSESKTDLCPMTPLSSSKTDL